jgi:hypothetical protein
MSVRSHVLRPLRRSSGDSLTYLNRPVYELAKRINRAERENLLRLARSRARVAKSEAVQREKVLLAEVEDLLSAEFEAQDELWAEAVMIAEEAARKANELIVACCADLGIPAKHAPKLGLEWRSRSDSFSDSARRGELRKLAESKLMALTATAKTIIDRKLVDTETALIADSLESDEACAYLAAMPTAEQLMPSLSLDDLSVKHWQSPEGTASALLSPSTPADRKRRQIRRGCDHKTIAAYRTVGNFPPQVGIPY